MSFRALLFCCLQASSITAAAHAQWPDCRANLDSLDARIQRNYAGFLLEVTGAKAEAYRDTLALLRAAADDADSADCYAVLDALTQWFEDPHLFVFQNPGADSAATRRTAESLRRTRWSEVAVRQYLQQSRTRLDPIEGIWYSEELRVGVVRDSGDTFIAVVLTPDTATWPVGVVRATFRKSSAGRYTAEVISRQFGTRLQRPVIHRNTILRFGPGTWGKAFPVAAADSGLLDPVDPRRPTYRLVDGVPVFTIPSHDPRYATVLDSLVRAHAPVLQTAPRLVIDLRGNEGGSSWMTRPLHPYIASTTRRSTPFDEDSAVMLSSPDQIRYVRRGFGPDTTPFVRGLVARLEARPGELVPLRESASAAAEASRDSVINGPTAVAVLIDRGTVSAAEVLVLRALRSTRATVFGEPTAGALDYQSTFIVRFHPHENRWLLGYPTIARKPSLPQTGMRGRGIAPDVHVSWSLTAYPIRYVMRALATGSK